MNILAVDLGFSHVKCALRNPESGDIFYEKFISATAKLPVPPDENDGNFCFSLEGDFYVLGSRALEQTSDTIMPLSNYDEMKVCYPIWISFLINKYQREFNVTFDKIAIGLSLTYRDKADDLITYLNEKLMFQDDDHFVIFPQGVSSKKLIQTYGMSLKTSERTSVRYDNWCGFDGGSFSLDLMKVSQSMTSSASSIGLGDYGTVRILNMISDYIFKQTGIKIDRETAKTIQESGEYKKRGRVYNLTPQVHEFTIKYLEEIVNLPDTNTKVGALVDSADKIIVLGGLGEIIKANQADFDKITESRGYPKGYWITPSFSCEFSNAISYLLIAEDKFK